MFSTEDLRPRSAQPSSHGGTRQRGCGRRATPATRSGRCRGWSSKFFEAAQSVRSYDLVLNLLEREVKREARKACGAHGAKRGGVPHHSGTHHPRDAGLRGGAAADALPRPRRERHRVYRCGSLAGLGGHSEVSLRTMGKEGKR